MKKEKYRWIIIGLTVLCILTSGYSVKLHDEADSLRCQIALDSTQIFAANELIASLEASFSEIPKLALNKNERTRKSIISEECSARRSDIQDYLESYCGKTSETNTAVKATTSAIYYVTSTGKKYHVFDCPSIEGKDNLKAYDSKQKAERAGYEACKNCID